MVYHTPWLDKFQIRMNDVWGYAKQNKTEKWWFDLEDGNWRNLENLDVALQTPAETYQESEQVNPMKK